MRNHGGHVWRVLGEIFVGQPKSLVRCRFLRTAPVAALPAQVVVLQFVALFSRLCVSFEPR